MKDATLTGPRRGTGAGFGRGNSLRLVQQAKCPIETHN